MNHLSPRIVTRKLPERVIGSANRRATVFRGRRNVHFLESRLTNDPLVGHAVERDSAGVAEIPAGLQLSQASNKKEQRLFQGCLHRSGEISIFLLPQRPSIVVQ